MGRQRKSGKATRDTATHGKHAGPRPGSYPSETGVIELRADAYSPGGFEVLVNGVPSSHIAEDPLKLEYEYMRWIMAIIEPLAEERLDTDKLRITHLGGGACSMARYLCARFPQSRNTVVELDGTLTSLVREWFDLPRAPRLKIRQGDARQVTHTFVPQSRDIIIRDVFAGSETPSNLTTVEFFHECAQSLSPRGIYVANCGDRSDLMGARAELVGMSEAFSSLGVIADPPMLKGRRYGNIILIGSNDPLPADNDATMMSITRELLGGGVPAQYKDHAWVRDFMAAGRARHDPA